MAVESPIEALDDWFVNEDKGLRFVLTPPEYIAGWTFLFELRRRRAPGPPLITKTSASGIVPTNVANGVVLVQINAADTVNLDGGSYHYVLWRTDPGNRTLLAFGGAVLRKAVAA